MNSFSVACLTNADRSIIDNFCRYYLDAGADQIFLYFDDASMETGFADKRVSVCLCDAAFWREQGMDRPEELERRQEHLYGLTLESCASKWLLIADDDEFVRGEVSIPSFLACVPDDVHSLAVTTAEAVFAPGDDLRMDFGPQTFRLPIRNRKLARLVSVLLYGRAGWNLQFALAGHWQGKQFLRVGYDFEKVSVHRTFENGQIVSVISSDLRPRLPRMHLLHFDAMSLPRWSEKCMRRITGRTKSAYMPAPRRRQLEAVASALERGPEAVETVFRSTYCLTRTQMAVLGALGLLVREQVL